MNLRDFQEKFLSSSKSISTQMKSWHVELLNELSIALYIHSHWICLINANEMQHCAKGNAVFSSDVFSRVKSIEICEMLLSDIYFTRFLRYSICTLHTGTVNIKKVVLRVRCWAGTEGDLTSAAGFTGCVSLCWAFRPSSTKTLFKYQTPWVI